LGLVVALGFEEGVKGDVEGLGVKALDRDDLLRIVELWDPLKQRTAVRFMFYYGAGLLRAARREEFVSQRAGHGLFA
jgi:hypothetical protein